MSRTYENRNVLEENASKNTLKTLRTHRPADPTPEATEKTSEKYMHKSAITEHMTQQSHIVDWGGEQIGRQRVGLEKKRHQRSDMDKKN